jgi:hypothetical protein
MKVMPMRNMARGIGGSNADKNYENYVESQAYANSWQKPLQPASGQHQPALMEQVFRTYHNRLRSGYDILTSSDRAVWTRAGIWAVRNGTAEMAIITEKAVLDLRKCRNGAACTNN